MLTLPQRPYRHWRLSMVLIAIPVILIGLVAMHFLASESVKPADAFASASIAAPAVSPDSLQNTTVPAGCAEQCSPLDSTLGIACVLALLVSVTLLVLHILRFRLRSAGTLRRLRISLVAILSPPTPPSLHVLSVSRT